MEKTKFFLSTVFRWALGNTLWEHIGRPVFILVSTALTTGVASMNDPLEALETLPSAVRFLIYFVLASILTFLLLRIWDIFQGRVGDKTRNAAKPEVTWELVPRDFGLDSLGSRRVGFAVEKPRRVFEATLEMFWFSGHDNPDEEQYRYALNLTSCRLRKTADGQFMLAIASPLEPFGFHLILEDGYYGKFLSDPYYKARVSIRANAKTRKTCFDVLIRYDGRASIEVVELNKIGCDDPLNHIPPEQKSGDDSSKSWSTIKDFQPNQMYREQ
jgi:hypothetical protein